MKRRFRIQNFLTFVRISDSLLSCTAHCTATALSRSLSLSLAVTREMACRPTHRRPWRPLTCLLLLPAVCSGLLQTLGGVRRAQQQQHRWHAQQGSMLTDRGDGAGLRRCSRWHECARVGVLRCSAGLTAVDEPASGSDVSARI